MQNDKISLNLGVGGSNTATVSTTQGTDTVHLARVIVESSDGSGKQAVIESTGGLRTSLQSPTIESLLSQIITELRVMNLMLQSGLNVKDDIDELRVDNYFGPQ